MTTEALRFDPFDPAATHHLWRVIERLQREAPVLRLDDDLYFVSRYADVRAVVRTPRQFANSGGFRRTGVEVAPEDRNLGDIDAPEHGPLRRLAFHAAAGPGVIDGAEPFARAASVRLLEQLRAKGGGDLVAEFSLALTNLVISRLLGVPDDDTDRVTAWGEEIMMGELPVTGGYANVYPDFTRYVDGLISTRLDDEDRPDDAIARIVDAALEREQIPVPMIRMILLQLLLGGTTTTRDLLGSVLLELVTRPDLHARLAADPTLVPRVVEEGLRLWPPVLFLIRTCVDDVELGGVTIPAGARVIAGLAAANRDPDVFEAPDEVRLDRPDPGAHLSFGAGPHLCVGAGLARMEATAALEAFLAEFGPGELTLAPGFELRYMPAAFLFGPQRVDVVLGTDRVHT